MAPSAQALRNLTRRMPPGPADLRRTAGIENATRRLLLVGVMPLWLGAGLADWYLHRRTRIEETAGPRESALHSLMFAETGVPVLLGPVFGILPYAEELLRCWRQPQAQPPPPTGRTSHRHPARPGPGPG